MTLTKAHMVNRIYERCGLAKKEAQEIVELVFNELRGFFRQGKSVKISGFGNFNVRFKRARRGRNPQTGGSMTISERRVLTFSVSQVFKEILKRQMSQEDAQAHAAEALSQESDVSREN